MAYLRAEEDRRASHSGRRVRSQRPRSHSGRSSTVLPASIWIGIFCGRRATSPNLAIGSKRSCPGLGVKRLAKNTLSPTPMSFASRSIRGRTKPRHRSVRQRILVRQTQRVLFDVQRNHAAAAAPTAGCPLSGPCDNRLGAIHTRFIHKHACPTLVPGSANPPQAYSSSVLTDEGWFPAAPIRSLSDRGDPRGAEMSEKSR
jgi:hypothetical protein